MAKSKRQVTETSKTSTSAQDRDRRIAERAYFLYEARGCEQGHDLEDWLTAEREIDQAA